MVRTICLRSHPSPSRGTRICGTLYVKRSSPWSTKSPARRCQRTTTPRCAVTLKKGNSRRNNMSSPPATDLRDQRSLLEKADVLEHAHDFPGEHLPRRLRVPAVRQDMPVRAQLGDQPLDID